MKKSLTLLPLFYALLAVMAWGGQAAAQQNATLAVQASMDSIWTARSGDIDAIAQDTTARLSAYTGQAAQSLADDLRAARSEFLRLSSLHQISRGHPTEQLTLVQQMRTVQQRIKKRFAPLESIADTITARLEEITALQKDLGDISQGMGADAIGAPAATQDTGLNAYKRSLNEAKKTLTSASAKLRTILTPARTIIARFDQDISNIENNLGAVWESYYITSSGISLDALLSIPAQLTDWVSSLRSRMVFAYPQSSTGWVGAGAQFFIAVLVVLFLEYFAIQGVRRAPDPWRTSLKAALKHSWVWISLGSAMLLASTNRYGGIYFGFVLIGSLILIAGVASLSWRLRIAAIPSLEDKPSPLRRLYLPAAFGVLMLFSDLPPHVLAVLWAVVMLTFLGMSHTRDRMRKEDPLPALERIFHGSTVWFGYLSLLGALVGFARLAILLFVFHFSLINIITMGSALASLTGVLAEKAFGEKDMPMSKALTEAVGIPLAWLFSLLCALPWLWAVPGAQYVISHALSANYTVGEATFDFSRLLFILVLFFLFRSLIDLSRTSLEHLPERLPSLERGVIPSLRALSTYALWALFAIIALGQVGVNFTSLAVVAGGLGVGIGFGLQNIFNNLVSGLMLIFGRSILVGDYVEVAGASGTVRAINIRSTIIETPERARVYVPNSAIMSGQFTNWTRNNRIVRRTLSIRAAYGSDAAMVIRLLLQAAGEERHILKKPAPVVYLDNFGDRSLDFSMNVFIDDFNNAASAMSDLRLIVERLFTEHGIAAPVAG